MAEESKNDLLLKRVQIMLAILTGVLTLIVGVYNLKKTVFTGGKGGVKAVLRTDVGRAGPLKGVRTELQTVDNILVHGGVSDAEGRFERDGIEAGTYVLKAWPQGYEPEARTLRVEAKKTTEIEILFRPSSALPGPGSPLRSAVEEVGASWLKKLGQPKESAETK